MYVYTSIIYIYIVHIYHPHKNGQLSKFRPLDCAGVKVGVQAVAALRKDEVPSLPHWCVDLGTFSVKSEDREIQ